MILSTGQVYTKPVLTVQMYTTSVDSKNIHRTRTSTILTVQMYTIPVLTVQMYTNLFQICFKIFIKIFIWAAHKTFCSSCRQGTGTGTGPGPRMGMGIPPVPGDDSIISQATHHIAVCTFPPPITFDNALSDFSKNVLGWSPLPIQQIKLPGGQQQQQPGGAQHDQGEGYQQPITFRPIGN